MYIVGDFANPKKETDREFGDLETAFKHMSQQANDTENYLVGLWKGDEDYALYVAINGEVFRGVN